MSKTIYFFSNNLKLEGKLEEPTGQCLGYVLFAHCFTCGKDIAAASRIASALVSNGFAVLRFDFTGLGRSEGSFSETNFSSNVEDLIAAADYLRTHYQPPVLLIGHSLGGAAVLLAARKITEVKAIATIGAPASAHHVKHHFSADLSKIESDGEAHVTLGHAHSLLKNNFYKILTDTRKRLKATLVKPYSLCTLL